MIAKIAEQLPWRSTVAKRLEDMCEFLKVFTDGLVCYNTRTTTAACHIPILGVEYAGILNIPTSSTTAVLAAIQLAVNHLLALPDKTRAVILSDPRSALQVLLNNENGSTLAQEVAEACRSTVDSE